MSVKADKDLEVLERNWEINFIGSKIPKTDYSVRILKDIINPLLHPISYWMIIKKDNGEVKKIQGFENERYITFTKVDFLNAFDSGSQVHFTFALSPKAPKSNEQNPPSTTNSVSLHGLEDMSLDANAINLYPNPVKKDQDFTIVFPKMEDLVIAIYDGGGRLVKLEKISSSARSYTYHLSVQSSYLVTLTQNGKIIKTFKLIVD
jgi:hypothetical protein